MNKTNVDTATLSGAALDWAVAYLLGRQVRIQHSGDDGHGNPVPWLQFRPHPKGDPSYWREYSPSTNWGQGGPLIDGHVTAMVKNDTPEWWAHAGNHVGGGPTPLIAAMRAIVAAKLGDEVEIPEELLHANN